jgi:hypothetical protein
VTSGPAADLSARTGWDGSYALYGVSGATEIRVSKAGYPSQLRSVAVQSHQTLDITLPAVAFPNVSGTYTMTLTADLGCSSPMDPPLNIRTYSANIVQSGRDLTVTLGGASFLVLENRGNGFPGTVDPEQVTFSLDDNNHFDIGSNPDVVELVGGLRVQMLFGKITTGITSNRLSGVLSGSITRADRAPLGGFFWGASCESSSHQVVFSR